MWTPRQKADRFIGTKRSTVFVSALMKCGLWGWPRGGDIWAQAVESPSSGRAPAGAVAKRTGRAPGSSLIRHRARGAWRARADQGAFDKAGPCNAALCMVAHGPSRIRSLRCLSKQSGSLAQGPFIARVHSPKDASDMDEKSQVHNLQSAFFRSVLRTRQPPASMLATSAPSQASAHGPVGVHAAAGGAGSGPRLHLIRFHGVLALNAKLRPLAVPQGPEKGAWPRRPQLAAHARPRRFRAGCTESAEHAQARLGDDVT